MVRRVNTTQLRNAVRRYNQGVQQYKRKLKQAVDSANREIRSHNTQVRANRTRISGAIARLRSSPPVITTTTYRTSVYALHEAYEKLESRYQQGSIDGGEEIFLLSERETANGLSVSSALTGAQGDLSDGQNLHDTTISNELSSISQDLHNRWVGALFSLNPQNPDAARHFCASTREVFTQILDMRAPDADVAAANPQCERTDSGIVTRRSKIRFLLHRRGLLESTLEDFVNEDAANILALFRVLNDGTHGASGRYDARMLAEVKKRVEDGILYLTKIAR